MAVLALVTTGAKAFGEVKADLTFATIKAVSSNIILASQGGTGAQRSLLARQQCIQRRRVCTALIQGDFAYTQ